MQTNQKILSDITVFMKYAKFLLEKNRRETWEELVFRNMEMHIKKYPELEEEIRENYKLVLKKKVLPSMRSMQFSGKPVEINNSRMYNCCALPIDHEKAFSEITFLLLGGTGVGYSVQRHDIEKLPEINKPKGRTRRYLIGDSIEGWADAVKVLMKSYFHGGSKIQFDFRDIRHKGAKLVTSGGKAPGPEPLKQCLFQIQMILDQKSDGEKLSSIEVHDIVCHIADAILAGGIRRAALICLFSFDDDEMISCKAGNWWELNPQRGRANNSAVILRSRISEEQFKIFFQKMKASGCGEPAIFFSNSRELLTNPCLSGDTLIAVADERKFVAIKELVGTDYLVLSLDENNNFCYKKALRTWKTRENSEILEIFFNNRASIKCTSDHKIRLLSGEYKEARELQEFDEIVSATEGQNGEATIKITKITAIHSIKNEDVYDIEVEDTHNFFANGICVHNCCEISLKPNQFCNLTEINASDLSSQEEFEKRAKCAAFIGTLQAGYTDFHYLRDVWRRTTESDALLGVSMTGIASGNVLSLDMKKAAEVVLEENERVADIIGVRKAARTTCVKPSGTTSLVLGCSSGIHAWHSDCYIRRIRVGKNESIYKYLSVVHPELVKDEFFRPHDTAVIEVPQKAPKNAILRNESALDLLERVKKVHSEWIKPGHRKGANTHNVSCTVSIKDDEWDDVCNWMWKNRDSFSGLSVLPFSDHSYTQAPFQDISEEEFLEMEKYLCELDCSLIYEEDDETDLKGEIACGPGGCDLK